MNKKEILLTLLKTISIFFMCLVFISCTSNPPKPASYSGLPKIPINNVSLPYLPPPISSASVT